jgi:predicted O-methyltransferase YrrM
MYSIKKLPGSLYGLKYRPSIEPEHDDNTDFYYEFYRPVPREFSPANQEVLKQALRGVPNARCIVEIGVQRNPLPESSTGILLQHRPAGCAFIGIDIEDKSHLAAAGEGIYTLQMDSADRGKAFRLMDQLGLEAIDFLFIDGWHSVNQCLADWQYVERLSPQGVVAMHDTNVHPGPVAVFEAIDEALFEKVKHCTGGPDWGIAVVKRKLTSGQIL